MKFRDALTRAMQHIAPLRGAIIFDGTEVGLYHKAFVEGNPGSKGEPFAHGCFRPPVPDMVVAFDYARLFDGEASDTRLVLMHLTSIDIPGAINLSVEGLAYFVSPQGQVVPSGRIRYWVPRLRGLPLGKAMVDDDWKAMPPSMVNHAQSASIASMLTCMFANVDNVVTRESAPTRAERRAAERVGAAGGVTYRTVQIGRPRTERGGPGAPTGRVMPLHHVRGYLRRRRDGGVEWIQSHWKGSASAGVVVKDYRVRRPA